MKGTAWAACGGLALAVLAAAPGGAQVAPYDVLSGLVGRSKAELIRRLGPPSDAITTVDGERLFYDTLDAGFIGGRSGGNTRAGGPPNAGFALRSYSFRCKTEVVVRAGRVQAFNRTGNDCR